VDQKNAIFKPLDLSEIRLYFKERADTHIRQKENDIQQKANPTDIVVLMVDTNRSQKIRTWGVYHRTLNLTFRRSSMQEFSDIYEQ